MCSSLSQYRYLPVLSDGVVLLDDFAEVKGVAFADAFNAEFIYNEGEKDRLPLVKPDARCDGSLVVSGFVEACGEDVVDKLSRFGKGVDTFAGNSSGILAMQTRTYS